MKNKSDWKRVENSFEIMETKGVPVLISSSGSPPTGDGSDHQIIRPTPRRATELVINNSNNPSDQIPRISSNNGHLESQDINKVNTLGLPILPSNPPPLTSVSSSSLPLTTVNSFSFPIEEPQSYNSHKQIKSSMNESAHKNDLDFSPRRVVRNNSQQYFEEKRNIFMGIKLDDRPQSQTPTGMSSQQDKPIMNNMVEKVSLVRKTSSSSPKNINKNSLSNNLQPIKMSLTDLIPKVHETTKMNNTTDHSEQIPVRDTDSTTNNNASMSIDDTNIKAAIDNSVSSSSEGGLVTNVVVDGTSSVPPLSNIPVTSSINKVSSVMYVSSTGTNEDCHEKIEAKNKDINASNDDSGYQILSSKDEEAERDPQKNGTVSSHLNNSNKTKKEHSKQGRSSLVKYKAYQGRSKPKRKPQSGSSRSRNNINSKSSSNAHFHSNDSNADDRLTKSLENANRLLDVKNAIEQLKIRSNHQSSNYTNPGYSSNDNDNTSTSSYSSASDDSDHISNTTKGSGIAASISSNSSHPISAPGIQSSLQPSSSLFSNNQQQIHKPYKNEMNAIQNLTPPGSDHFNSDHIPLKNDHQQSQQHQQLRSIQNKRGPGHNNVPDEAHNTTVTSADEFVWIDSYNRLVELQKFPWNHTDLCTVISSAQSGRDMTMPPIASSPGGLVGGGGIDQQEHRGLFHSADILPRLSYYLQRALVRIAREAQRLSKVI